MFPSYTNLCLQKDARMNYRGKMYRLYAGEDAVGTVEEKSESTTQVGNQLLKFLGLHTMVGVELIVEDQRGDLLGTIQKGKGINKGFSLYDEKGQHIGAIAFTGKMSAPAFTLVDHDDTALMKAEGDFSVSDFSVVDCESGKKLPSIKKRSFTYDTMKDNLMKEDGYFMECAGLDELRVFGMIAMSVLVDVNYHSN
ncbi:hypothetical protein N782_14975 [Pontibacillus yanchengensis Y32]|uniref:Uncharacterized protein n=2 Tax=Pontibacillus yanchengensis TaxID=462910 RepID=A0A0A2TEY9_9BACI|nr:hypothetical protein N782_14975 [Pontibacillus yanchengensis Y32]